MESTWEQFTALAEADQVARVLDVMAEVVAEAGEGYVYQRHLPPAEHACRYVADRGNGPQADCIAARVLARLGVSLDHLAAHEGETAQQIAAPLGMGPDAAYVLNQAQGHQDPGQHAWGAVLAYAREAAAGLASRA